MGASWGHIAPVCAVLGASWGRLGGVLGPSWAPEPPERNLTRHGTGSAVLFKGSFMQKPCGTTLDRKVSSRSRTLRSLRSLRSLPRCARPAGFHWGFAGVLLGFRWRSWIANLPNALQIFRKILGKSNSLPPKIHPKTLQNRPQHLKKSRSGGGCDLDCLLLLFVRRLGPSWGVLGASWGRLGVALGPSWGVLGASLGFLEPSWGVLELSWAVLGPRRGFKSDF